MRTIKTAVIGTGFMGRTHVEALRRVPGVEIVAIADEHQDAADALAAQFGIPGATSDWRTFLSDAEIEVVHNTTPNDLHYEINKAVLEAGKHIVSEKPLTMTSKESAELVALARKTGLVNAINFNYRFYPVIQHARGICQRGELGRVFMVHGHYIQDWLLYDTDYNWRIDSKVSGASRSVADIGSHWCDLVQFITGMKITRVFADLIRVHEKRKKPNQQVESFKGKEVQFDDYTEVDIDTEDGANVLVQFDSGAKGVFTVSQVSAGRKNHEWFEIDGSKMAIAWNQERPNELWMGYRDKPNEVLIKDPSLLDENARTYAHYPGGHPEGYPDGPKNNFRNVYRFIRDGKKPGQDQADFPTFEEGHFEVKMVEAVLKSAAESRWVEID
jgi:predicted dehydrogenase